MPLYPKNQTYVIIPWILGKTRFPEFFAVARKNIPEKLWIWNYINGAKILKEFIAVRDCKMLTHDEALEKMQARNWIRAEKEL